ncbi:MAG: ADP-ribosylation factor-like protein [Candidatus Hodarchaeota archaeon]
MIFQKIFLFGIDNAGKTTLSQVLRTGNYEGDIFPTTSYDIHALFLKHFKESIEFKIWDAPGQIIYRSSWDEGCAGASILIYALDTSEKARFIEAQEALQGILGKDETKGVPLIFLYHKIDKDQSKKNYYEAQDTFKPALIPGRDVYVIHTSIHEQRLLDDLREVIAKIMKKTRE